MLSLNPWINFNGNALEAFEFYRSTFGGEFKEVVRLKDKETNEFPVAPEDQEKVLSIILQIGDSYIQANDVPTFLGKVNENENRSKIVVTESDTVVLTKIYQGLSQGGSVEFELGDDGTGHLFGCFRDKFGIEWILQSK